MLLWPLEAFWRSEWPAPTAHADDFGLGDVIGEAIATGANVNTANLDTLAEPYPQVISGTPDSYSFDNGTFSFSYSTEEADGLGSFPAGSQTTISVPAVEFPDGCYQVTVTGGEVVSPPNAAELVIASSAGASAVTVTVSPAGT